MTISISKLARRAITAVALGALVVAMGGTWMTVHSASASPTTSPVSPVVTTSPPKPPVDEHPPPTKPVKKELSGKLNLNTATEEQLMLLPTVGPSKADRIVAWRKKNGGFKRVADLRRVKGFGYRTFKRLEPFLDIKGDTTLK
jgi:competence ComEA-like helix-hairpin-helix protein